MNSFINKNVIFQTQAVIEMALIF